MPKRENEENTADDRLRWDPKSKVWTKRCEKCNEWFVPNQEHPSFEEFCPGCSSLTVEEKKRLQAILSQVSKENKAPSTLPKVQSPEKETVTPPEANDFEKCPKCGKYSMRLNPETNIPTCINMDCNHIITNTKPEDSQVSSKDWTLPDTQEKHDKVPTSIPIKSNIPVDNSGDKQSGKARSGNKPNQSIPNWLIPLILIFALSIIGIGFSVFTGTLIPFWMLLGFSVIFSIEKWLIYYTRKYKWIGKLYRLFLNLGILSLLGLLIWTGIKLFSQQFIYSTLAGSLIFLSEFIFFIWIWKIVSKNSWRWPSMKLTIFSLIILFIIFAFAGVSPFVGMKDSAFQSISSWSSNLNNPKTSNSSQSSNLLTSGTAIPTLSPSPSENIITDKILNPQWWSGTDQNSIVSRSQTLFELTNLERSKNGLHTLQRNSQLDKLAQEKAQSMYDANSETNISHSGFDARASVANNLGFTRVAENIAFGGFEASSFDDMWMNSPGHRANILDKTLTHVGIGIYGKYAVQFFGGY